MKPRLIPGVNMNETDTLKTVYSDCPPLRPNVAALASELGRWYRNHTGSNFLHPCIIDGKPALVCQRSLSRENALAYEQLQAIALKFGLYLKEDARSKQLAGLFPNRRQKIGLVLSFCVGLAATPQTVSADTQPQVMAAAASANLAPLMSTMQATVVAGSDGRPVIQLQHRRPPTAEQVL